MSAAQITAIIIFAGVMALVATEKVHRASAALAGAMLVFLAGILSFDEGMAFIDFNTLGVLIGMMLFVGVVEQSGLFEYLAYKAAKLAKGDPWRVMVALIAVTALCSAFLDNVTTVLLIAPMTLTICRLLDVDPVPFFMTQIFASNVGGTATLIGDPPNIMVGSAANLSFNDFLAYDAPVTVIVLGAFIVLFYLIYGRTMSVAPENEAAIMALDERGAVRDRTLLHRSVFMIFAVVAAFMLHGQLGLQSAVVALTAAAIMLLIGNQDIEDMIGKVEWTTIGFFAGLFIVVGALSATGVVSMIAQALMDGGRAVAATTGASETFVLMLAILWVSAFVSALLDNIPFMATMIPIIIALEGAGLDAAPLWWAVSLGACLGGNGTLIGASANVVLAGVSAREGHPITFMGFLKIGMPLMIVSMAICTAYLVIRFPGT